MISSERLSKLKNRKIILGLVALLMALVVICVSSFIPYIIKPENLHSEAFITDLLINTSIIVLAMICMMFIAQASNAQNPKSKIAKSTVSFIESKNLINKEGLSKFKQWIKKVQQPGDIADIKDRILMSAGIEDKTIINLEIPEIRSLENKAQIINNVPYPSLTKKQIKILIKIKTKGLKVKLVPPEYYTNVKNISTHKTKSERAQNESKKKIFTLLFAIAARIGILVVFSSIFVMLVRDITQEPATIDAVATLFSRLWNFFTSCFLGYILGCRINDLDAEYIDMRVETHYEFLEDKTFVSLSVKELAKEEYINRMKEEQRIPLITEQKH